MVTHALKLAFEYGPQKGGAVRGGPAAVPDQPSTGKIAPAAPPLGFPSLPAFALSCSAHPSGREMHCKGMLADMVQLLLQHCLLSLPPCLHHSMTHFVIALAVCRVSRCNTTAELAISA